MTDLREHRLLVTRLYGRDPKAVIKHRLDRSSRGVSPIPVTQHLARSNGQRNAKLGEPVYVATDRAWSSSGRDACYDGGGVHHGTYFSEVPLLKSSIYLTPPQKQNGL